MIVDNRYSLQLSRAGTRTTDELVQIPLPGAVGFTTQWQNAGTVVGNTLEGTFEAEMLRRGTTSWKLGLTFDRSRNHIEAFNRSCVRTNTISYRCTGEDLGTMWGNAFVHARQSPPARSTAPRYVRGERRRASRRHWGQSFLAMNTCGARRTPRRVGVRPS
jgi:hypothetical protein